MTRLAVRDAEHMAPVLSTAPPRRLREGPAAMDDRKKYNQIETDRMIRKMGFQVESVDIQEFAKAEGGVTCLSIIFDVT